MHESLRERLNAAQRRIDHMTSELQEIGRRRQLPLKKFGGAQVKGFAEAIRTEVLAPGCKFAKGYLRALVAEIRISAAGGAMKGSNADADMAGAISGWRPGNPHLAVPRHVSNWRAASGSHFAPRPALWACTAPRDAETAGVGSLLLLLVLPRIRRRFFLNPDRVARQARSTRPGCAIVSAIRSRCSLAL